MRHRWLIAGLLAGIVLVSRSSDAQYTADFQTNIISGLTNNWSGDYYVGNTNFADVLLIQSSGVLSNGTGYLGYETSGSNNSAVVTGAGSVWSNAYLLYVGYSGAGNSLVISNGGKVFNNTVLLGGEEAVSGFLGYNSGSSNNSVLVTDTGSVWSSGDTLYVGSYGAGNSLVISNGGKILTGDGWLGSSSNTVLVTDSGSVWSNRSGLSVGGVNNSVLIRNGGQVYSDAGYVYSWYGGHNRMLVTDTGSVWYSGLLSFGRSDVDNSLVISNGGRVVSRGGSIGAGDLGSSSNNSVLVSGSGSIWSNDGALFVGGADNDYSYAGDADNRLVISDGGEVINGDCYVGYFSSSSINSVLVAGIGSVWKNDYDLHVGHFGVDNSLVISNGGKVCDGSGYVGFEAGSDGNSVRVSGTGSVWSNSAVLNIGYNCAGNNMVISNGGHVFSACAIISESSSGSNNNVIVTGAGTIWDAGCFFFSGHNDSLVIAGGGLMTVETARAGGIGGNNVTITGSGSVMRVSLCFRLSGSEGSSLVISNGGQLYTHPLNVRECYDSAAGGGSNHNVIITGSGSIWSSTGDTEVSIFPETHGSELLISHGGKLITTEGATVGAYAYANIVSVAGTGSVWSSQFINLAGMENTMVISEDGQILDEDGSVAGSSNSVRVSDGGVWQNYGRLEVGGESSNSLFVADGSVLATNILVASAACDNLVQLDGGSVVVTNASTNAVLEVSGGKFILNGGVLQVDKLVITNTCGLFVRNGGTLIVGSLVLDPALDADGDGLPNGWEQSYGLDPLDSNGVNDANGDPDGDGLNNLQEYLAGSNPVADIKTITKEGNDIRVTWQTAAAKTNALQRSAGGDDGSYSNNFADIFVVTNATGSVTNYLDLGAVTNFPAGYYRVRLVP